MVNAMLKVPFAEMYVHEVFVKLLVQHNDFNSCQRMALYRTYYHHLIATSLPSYLD